MLVGLIVFVYGGFRLKSIGDEAFDRVGLGNSDIFASWYTAMGFHDFGDEIILPTKDLVDAENENFERFKWNLDNPDRTKKPEISINHLTDEHKQKVQKELDHLYSLGQDTAIQTGILTVLFLIAALMIFPKKMR